MRPAIESKFIAIHNNARKCRQIRMVSSVLYSNRKPALLRALNCGITRGSRARQIVTYENIRLGVRAKDTFPGGRLSRASEWQTPEYWRTKVPAGTSLLPESFFWVVRCPCGPSELFSQPIEGSARRLRNHSVSYSLTCFRRSCRVVRPETR
jgi:hypothetical protein